jgi:hypothetical protein
MTERKIADFTDSPGVRLAVWVIGFVTIPFFMWFATRALNDLDELKKASVAATIQSANIEGRLKITEATTAAQSVTIQAIGDAGRNHTYDIKRLEDKVELLKAGKR